MRLIIMGRKVVSAPLILGGMKCNSTGSGCTLHGVTGLRVTGVGFGGVLLNTT